MRATALICTLFVAALASLAGAAPLNIGDPAPRSVRLHFETSSDPATIGESFDSGWLATWSVVGNVGRVELSVETHEQARETQEGLNMAAVPGSFAAFVVEIDLTTLEATTLGTTGILTNGTQSFGFTTHILDTTATGGIIGPDTPPLFCSSQQEVDDLCVFVPILCGQICTLVPGAAYDLTSGELNLIGSEEQSGCDGAVCFDPVWMFARTGDLMLSELPPGVPAASTTGHALLALLLTGVASARLSHRRQRQRSAGTFLNIQALFICALASGWLAAAEPALADPLDPADPSTRAVSLHFANPGGGEPFDTGWPATWSVSGSIGRVELSIESHEVARAAHEGLGMSAVPETFAPVVVEIDLGTLEATSQVTAGSLTNGTQSFGFTTRALDTTAIGGFVGPDTGPLFCTSQQQVDDACAYIPFLCGQVCTLVPGAPYDPGTGELRLIGSEEQAGCDGSACFGPFENFAPSGQLLLSEVAPGVPAVSGTGRLLLALLLGVAAGAVRACRP